jgi:3-phenylpropionate/cinnamic acid dioxygenase small subunit
MARLAAESEIRNIVARLGHLADDGDIDEYLSLMTEDAEWGIPGRPARKGHEALRARVLEDRASGIQGPGSASRHVNTALWVNVDGERAVAESYFLYITNANGGTAGSTTQDATTPNVQMTGRYHDEFVSTPTGWKLRSRTILLHIN